MSTIIIVLFPLLVDKTGFFKILECKYRYFVLISSIYVIISTIIYLVGLITKKIKFRKVSKIQWLAIAFLVVNIISCFLSPFFSKYNLFIGVGRGEGLITSALYILSFLYVSYFGKFKKKYILYFSISSILLVIIFLFQDIRLKKSAGMQIFTYRYTYLRPGRNVYRCAHLRHHRSI